MKVSDLPAGIGLSYVRVYEERTPDGQCGGTPHAHLLCGEMYVVIGGEGAAEFIDAQGVHRQPLRRGDAVSFTPGTVHRLVNRDRLEILVVMENGALNELGDVVFTFPEAELADHRRYRELADPVDISARRDLAVRGFTELTKAWETSPEAGRAALRQFHEHGARLHATSGRDWVAAATQGPAKQAFDALIERAEAAANGDPSAVAECAVTVRPALDDSALEPRMCGWLWPYWKSGPAQAEAATIEVT
jgi:uncharacterized cupin superfamily protein